MLARIRGFLVLLYAAVAMVTLFLVSLPVMLVTRSGDLPIWFARRVWSPLGLWFAGARLEISAPPVLPDGPAIFASNHESALDIWALFIAIPRLVRFIAKQELFDLPVFGWYMRIGGHVAVDRSNRVRAVSSLRSAGALVRSGTSVIVFPEGTRSRTGRIQSFKKGPFVVAKEAGVPVVPVAISGSGTITPSKTIAVHRGGTIRLAFGEPVDPAAFPTKEALLAEVRARIIALHRGLGGLGGDLDRAVAAAGVEGDDEPDGTPATPP
jgi:1-acyl-sn-glycerol-3-phosphate acyltransferase